MPSRIIGPIALALAVALLHASPLRAGERMVPERLEAPAASTPLGTPTFTDPEVTLEVWNRPIVTFRASFGPRTPAKRAEHAEERISELPYGELSQPVTAIPVYTAGGQRGVMIQVGDHYVFTLAEADLDTESGESFDAFVARAEENLHAALEARVEQRQSRVLLRALAVALPATLLFVGLVWALARARRWIGEQLSAQAQQSETLTRLGFGVRRQAALIAQLLAGVLTWAFSLVAAYVWLTLVLTEFPYTEPWGERLGAFLRDTVLGLARGALGAVPGFVVIALIFLVTRALVAFAGAIFESIERGRVRSSWFDSETARATRRVVSVLLWIFAATAAYPHIPGSNTEAFRGISVFIGVVVSLGSTGVVNQVMSGLVVIYSRTLRPGDWVRVGEVEGQVTEVGMLSTKLSTVRREQVAIPNAVLVGTSTTNFSSLSGDEGPLVSTAVTIGYDVPWRQVHALLLLAASRTPGVRERPEPRVLQRGLSDYYVEYQLLAHLERASDRFGVLSDLHANIQDAFNEHGVQIMSPHFVMQPSEPVTVPKPRWFAAPAQPEAKATDAKAGA